MNNLSLSKAVRAAVSGLIAGLVVALIIVVINALVPPIDLDAGFWGWIVGVLVFLYNFLVDADPSLRR